MVPLPLKYGPTPDSYMTHTAVSTLEYFLSTLDRSTFVSGMLLTVEGGHWTAGLALEHFIPFSIYSADMPGQRDSER